jgi:RNA polymerase sigma factor for flagellar operon FliA
MNHPEAPENRRSPLTAEQRRFAAQKIELVRTVAKTNLHKFDASVDLDELISYGQLGLVEAVREYDPKRGTPFEGFAWHRIYGAMVDEVRNSRWYTRQQQKHYADKARLDECREMQRRLSDSLEIMAEVLDRVPVVKRVGLAEAADRVAEGPSPESVVHLVRIRDRVAMAAADLKTIERQLADLYFVQDKTLDEAAAKLGKSKSWASRQVDRLVGIFRQSLGRTDG